MKQARASCVSSCENLEGGGGANRRGMRVDVSIEYQGGRLRLRSEAAGCDETRPALILMSRGADGFEYVEAVGYHFGVEERKAAWERDKGSRTYRCFDPFDALRFEPEAAAAVVRHLCLYAHANVKPRRRMWRALWGLDRFSVRVKIPDYGRVPAEKRADFERRLRKRLGRVEVSG